jgi:hypothetical protein
MSNTPKKYEPADTALRYLVAKIEQGFEYPEAECQTMVRFGLSDLMVDRLRRAYDSWDAAVTKVMQK